MALDKPNGQQRGSGGANGPGNQPTGPSMQDMFRNALASTISGVGSSRRAQASAGKPSPTSYADSRSGGNSLGYSAMGTPISLPNSGNKANGSSTTGHDAFTSGHGVGYPGGTQPQWQGRLNTALDTSQMYPLGRLISGGTLMGGAGGQGGGGLGGGLMGNLGSGNLMNALANLFSSFMGGGAGTGGSAVPATGGGSSGIVSGQTQPNQTGTAVPGPGGTGSGYNAFTGQYGYSRDYGPVLGRQIAGEGPVLGAVNDYYGGPRRASFASTHGEQERQY